MSPEPEELNEEDLIALARLEGKPMPEKLKTQILEEIRKTPEKERESKLNQVIDELGSEPENDTLDFES